MEQQIANAIWEMLASGFDTAEIRDGFETVNIDGLIDEVFDEYDRETTEGKMEMPYE